MEPHTKKRTWTFAILLLIVGFAAYIASDMYSRMRVSKDKAQSPQGQQEVVQPRTIPEGWELGTADNGTSTFLYPRTLGLKYMHEQEWPPRLSFMTGSFSCIPGRTEVQTTYEQSIAGAPYCVSVLSEGAAGSMFVTYRYAFARTGGVGVITFTVRETQCGVYDDPQKSACENERAQFNPDTLAESILKTIQ